MSSQLFVFLVDDDYAVRDSLRLVIENAGFVCQAFESAEQFLGTYSSDQHGCLLLDVNMPGMSGDELQAELNRRNIQLPIIFLTAFGSIPMTVRVMKAGAIDVLTKPVPSKFLIERIQVVLEQELEKQVQCSRLNTLTLRELELLPLLVAGLSNKEIGRQIGISYRTMEVHRARILHKTGVSTLLELGHLCEACNILTDPKP